MSETQSAAPSAPASSESATTTETPSEGIRDSIAGAVKEAERKYKLKVNGRETEMDERSLVAHAQRGLAADEKFQKASLESKRVAQLLNAFKSDPARVMQELAGIDPTEFSKAQIAKELRKLSMSPQELELENAREELAQYKKERQAQKETELKAQNEQATQFYIKKFDTEIQ
jgi:hypothetical protein